MKRTSTPYEKRTKADLYILAIHRKLHVTKAMKKCDIIKLLQR